MAYNFPSSPTVGQVYQGYTWDGEKWAVAQSGGKTQRFIFTPAAGTTVLSGADANGLTLSYTPGAVEVSINGIWLDFSEYTATNGTSIVLPSATAAGDRIYVYALSSFSVLDPLNAKKNYIVNGAMMVSQENGSTAGTTSNYYAVDQFRTGGNSTSGTYTFGQVASVTPAGSPNRVRFTVTSADAAVGATDFVSILQPIEGLRAADLMFGTASAKMVTLRFGVKAPAGTYSVTIKNSALDRSYVAEYVISAGEANTDVIKSVTIPGDQSGTWLKDTGVGIYVYFNLMMGSNYQGAAGAWTASAIWSTSNQFNIMGTNGNVFELFDVGLYEGVVAPSYEVPNYAMELASCQRYFYRMGAGSWVGTGMIRTTNTASYILVTLPVPMRSAPTLSIVGSCSNYVGDTSQVATFGGVGMASAMNTLTLNITHAALGAGGNACMLAVNVASAVNVSARL